MLVLFINGHKKTPEGEARFAQFLEQVRGILRKTVYFGNEVEETVRRYDDLQDYIYDEVTLRLEQRAKHKFDALSYIFIDGSCGTAPWSPVLVDLMLIIRTAISTHKKIYCNGVGHFAAYHYLATKFDKYQAICKGEEAAQHPHHYQYDPATGDLSLKNKRVCNGGVMLTGSHRPYADRSHQAQLKGVLLPTKFHCMVFDSKNGQKITHNIETPFSFYWKSRVFCTPKAVSKVDAHILFQTETGCPLVFVHQKLLSTQALCPQFLKLLNNWLLEHSERLPEQTLPPQYHHTISFENKLELAKTLTPSRQSFQKPPTGQRRLISAKLSQAPAVRCSGRYQTENERYLEEQQVQKSRNLGRSRMVFQGSLSELSIRNYVHRTPSRPASSHKFRDVLKDKWVGNRDFYS